MMKHLIWSLIMVVVVAGAALAQSTNQGAIVGRITDDSEAILPGAGILAQNLDTGVERATTADQRGDYRLDFLQPGRYRVQAMLAGFGTATAGDVGVHVSEIARVDLRLSPAGVEETVVVSSPAGVGINTENATVGQVITERAIRNMPLNGREFIQLSGLVPGADTGNTKRGAVENKGFSVSFNGARGGHNAYYVDGADSTDANTNQLISSPSLDAVKEFRVETSLYSARYGRAGGAIVNVVTKSGTNRFSGSLYEYHRGKKLDAKPYFYQGSDEDEPDYKFDQFGGTIGGPIVRNKTFFFAANEYYRQIKPGQVMESFAPTERERRGDFTESINPYTGHPVELRNPFTGQRIESNILPAELFNPVGQRLMELWPEPNYPQNPVLNLRLLRSGAFDQDKLLTKVDHNFSPRTSLSASYNYSTYDNTSVGNTIYSDANVLQHDRTFVGTLTHTFSDRLVNDLKVNYTRFANGSDFVMNDKNYGQEWGFWTGSQKPAATGPPRILFYTVGSRIFQIGGPGPNVRDNENLYIRDDLVLTAGAHMLSFGGDFKRQHFDWTISNATPFGAYYFGILDGDPAPALASRYLVSGSAIADVLMGVTARTTYDTYDGVPAQLTRSMFALYVQDDWRVSPRLTLNIGLRYDFEQPFTATDNQFLTLNYETGMPRYSAGAPAEKLALLKFPYETGGPNRPYEASRLNFAPRFGFAWRPFADNRTAVRGGYGMVYNSENAYTTTYGAWVVPFSGQYEYYSRGVAWPDGRDRFVPVDQEPIELTYPAGTSPGTFQPTTPDYAPGALQHWNLAVAREIGWQTDIDVAYIGSRGVNLGGVTSLAAYDPGLWDRVRQNVPAWGSIGLRLKGFSSNYHALQAKANKRLSNDLSFLASYTWSHAMAEASNDDVNENSIADINEIGEFLLRRQWSNADFDIRHRFSLSAAYELPLGRERAIGRSWHPVVDGVLGGWSMNLLWTAHTGRPYSVRIANGNIPDRICGGELPASERAPDRWFDFSCFPNHVPQQIVGPDGIARSSTQGNAGTNNVRGPGWNSIDFGLHKNVRVKGSARMQFRAEAFNLLNRPNLIGPSNNFFVNQAVGANITRAGDSRSIQLAVRLDF